MLVINNKIFELNIIIKVDSKVTRIKKVIIIAIIGNHNTKHLSFLQRFFSNSKFCKYHIARQLNTLGNMKKSKYGL